MTTAWDQFDTGLSEPLRAKLNALRQQWGREFKLNSGYRDPRYNFLVGGAKSSQHLSGNAADIDTSSWSEADRVRFLQQASKIGFGGLGVYDNAIHLDTGPKRAWGKDHTSTSIPMWSRVAIDPHLGTAQSQGPARPVRDVAQRVEPETNAFAKPEADVYGYGRSRPPGDDAPTENAFAKWGNDHYGQLVDWGDGGKNYV